nr:phosphate/phosphite/phosphonate ABC transporter substrate-binding protein [Rhodoferax sp.]
MIFRNVPLISFIAAPVFLVPKEATTIVTRGEMHVRFFSLGGRNLRQVILSAVLLAACVFSASSAIAVSPTAKTEAAPLQMGVLPTLSSELLFQAFLPMKDYLEAQLKRRIVLSTAPDFKTYVQRAVRGDYDIYQTAPHFALLAETEQGYRRVSRFTRELDGYVVVRRESPAQRVEDLRGRIVITPDTLAITSLLGEQLLKEHGLTPGKDYRLERTTSHNNAIMTVYRRNADAALTSAAVFEQLAPEIKRELRVLTKTRAVPHMMIMAHQRLSAVEYTQLKQALLAFTRNGSGRKFFEATGYGDMGPITDADMARLQPFLEQLKERLK